MKTYNKLLYLNEFYDLEELDRGIHTVRELHHNHEDFIDFLYNVVPHDYKVKEYLPDIEIYSRYYISLVK